MAASKPSQTQKIIPFLGGLLLALLVCGIPVFWFVSNGKFHRVTEPFAYAVQTVAVPATAPQMAMNTDTVSTATADSSVLPYSKRFEMAGDDISEALNHFYNHEYAEES